MRVIVVITMLAARLAAAEDSAPDQTTAVAIFAEGQRQYQAEKYEDAAKLFVRAYETHPDPVYLFNAAQAYRHATNCKAHEYYTRFLEAVPDPPNRDEIHGYITTLAPCPKPESPPPPTTSPPASPEPEPLPSPPRDTPPSSIPRAPIAAFAFGLAGVIGGAVFTARVGAHERDANALCGDADCVWTADKTLERAELDRRARRDRTIAIASFSLGGVAILGGVALYVLARSSRSETVAITPTTGGVMAAFAGRF